MNLKRMRYNSEWCLHFILHEVCEDHQSELKHIYSNYIDNTH
jgi:hypothetical protein